MDSRKLSYFLKICETGSIAKAAEVLFISQQALSKSIAKLEKEVGVPLLVRTPEGVRLTVAGQLLEQRAGLYLEEHDDILRQLRDSKKAPGQERIYTAGQKEYLVWLERRDKGVPVGEGVQRDLLAVRDYYHLPYTFPFEN